MPQSQDAVAINYDPLPNNEAEEELEEPSNSSQSSDHNGEVKPKFRLTVEPMLFIHMLGYSISSVAIQSFWMNKICMSNYANESLCSNLTGTDEETDVQEIYSKYSIYQSFIELGVPILFCMFLAPWLDKNGSKIGMVLPLIGAAGSLSIYFSLSLIQVPFSPAFILFSSLPISLSGGIVAFILSSFTYIANITTATNRTFRIAIVEGCWFAGSPIGILSGAQILKYGGYKTVFATSTALFSLSLLYAIFFIKNDKKPTQEDTASTSICSKIVEFLDISSFVDTLRTVFRKRSGYRRLNVILLLVAICLRLLVFIGSMKVAYMFTREKFGWSEVTFSTYTTFDGIIGVSGGALIIVVGMKLLKLSDTILGVIGIISAISGTAIWTLAYAPYMMYLGAAAQMFGGVTSMVIRSMISKLVPHSELGKIFSFLAIAEATIPLFSGSLFSILYMKTLHNFIGTVYLVCTGINAISLFLFLYFHFTMKNNFVHRVELENEDDSDVG